MLLVPGGAHDGAGAARLIIKRVLHRKDKTTSEAQGSRRCLRGFCCHAAAAATCTLVAIFPSTIKRVPVLPSPVCRLLYFSFPAPNTPAAAICLILSQSCCYSGPCGHCWCKRPPVRDISRHVVCSHSSTAIYFIARTATTASAQTVGPT